ncbi:Mv-ORF92 peptide [Maruca vitrata nucleopolyhedrovirus]|uniref:Mv-ORF92 peptide n=1 Tax=Maruca vitrata nucleopolyhedrovirus TaxID=1307954 RepID=A1YRF4_9ABAC|nr:Mv-ORF92 peptide [Maruca vitrata nucleopolyhedrovirus]ABL76044.1 Mv-ORF92 peptide [Maruca vitrata nucleopolyhedrovirus]
MSILKVVEAYDLANTFFKLGYLFRAKTCLNIAIENLEELCEKTNIKKVVIMLNKKIAQCLQLKQKIDKKITQRVLIKIHTIK